MFDLPAKFAQTIVDVYGAEGRAWLNRLPATIAACEQRWSVTVQAPFPRLSYNFVAPCRRSDGQQLVLKLGVPCPELLTEIGALRLYGGRGIVQLVDADEEQGWLLLERVLPGTPLASVDDDVRATSIAAQVMRKLWQPVTLDAPFPSVARWAAGLDRMRRRFDGGTGPLPERLVVEAETLFRELIASMGEPVLLHGDLHHENILAAQREPWLALDPKGVIGEREYEVGALLRNQLQHVFGANQPARAMERRVWRLADELACDRRRLRDWSLAQAVLSAWWCIEDHGSGWEPAIACAELLTMVTA